MIDLRCHLLDGTPCGPASFATSLQICKEALNNGVRTIVATPLWAANNGEPPLPFDECERKINRLLNETGGLLSIKPGFVLQFGLNLHSLVERYSNKLAVGGQRHLLVSLPALEVPTAVEDVWETLSQRGFRIIVTHPECNPALRRQQDRLSRWVSAGVVLQVDAASVMGVYGREVQRFTLNCLRRYEGRTVVTFNTQIKRMQYDSMAVTRRYLVGQLGEATVAKLFKDLPQGVLNNTLKEHSQLQGPMPRRIFSMFRLSSSSPKDLTDQ